MFRGADQLKCLCMYPCVSFMRLVLLARHLWDDMRAFSLNGRQKYKMNQKKIV